MARYLIIGCGGSGKSTLARTIAQIGSIPYIDTDSMYWRKDWKVVADAEVVRDLPLDSPSWTIDGNFVDFREQVWKRADHIIWLNYPFHRTLWRLSTRNLGWWLTRKPVWSGNKMSLDMSLSGIRHFLRQYPRVQKTFPLFLAERTDQHISIFTSPQECEAWLAQFRKDATPLR